MVRPSVAHSTSIFNIIISYPCSYDKDSSLLGRSSSIPTLVNAELQYY